MRNNLTSKDVDVLSEALNIFISDDIDDINIKEKLNQNSLAFK